MSERGILHARQVFPERTGSGIKVAVVDSGINPAHSHVQRVAGGIHISSDADGCLKFDADSRDHLGHGTAVAAVIRTYASDVELYSARVFGDSLATNAHVVAAAIRWAAEQQMQIINVSLSTGNTAHRELLRKACDLAESAGAVVIAATDGESADLFPACFNNVIAVSGCETYGWGEYSSSAAGGAQFRAHPAPRPLPGRDQRRNLRGHSFAVAHVTGLAARVLQAHPGLTRGGLIAVLAAPLDRSVFPERAICPTAAGCA
jgi:subtilisin family serine protease